MHFRVYIDEDYQFDVLNVGVIMETQRLKKWQSSVCHAEPVDQAITFEQINVGRKYMHILVFLDEYYQFDVLNVGIIMET
jgi:hypothetical protein